MAILAYTKQSEFDLVHSEQYCIGMTAVDQAGNELGKVTDMLIDSDAERVDSIMLEGGVRVPAADIAIRDNRVIVRGVLNQDEYAQSRTTATTATTDSYAAFQRPTNAQNVTGVTRAANEGEVVLPIIEEQLSVGKRTVERGETHIRTTVEEVPVEEQVRLREEHVTVERRPVDRPVTGAPGAFQEGVIEVTEMAEVPVVAKEARVVEEVVVNKEVVERQQTVRDTVKRTEVDVDEVNTNDVNTRTTNR